MNFETDDVFDELEGKEGYTVIDQSQPDEDTDPASPDVEEEEEEPTPDKDDKFSFQIDGSAIKDVFSDDEEIDAEKAVEKIRGLHTSLTELKQKSEKFNENTFAEKTAELERLQTEMETLMQAVDPMSHFVDENSYKTEQLRKLFPNIPLPVINSVMSEKFEQMEPLDTLRLYAQYRYKWSDPTKIDSWIEGKYGVDLMDDEFTVSPVMEADSVDYKEQMSTIREKEVDAPVDYKSKIDEMKATKEKQFETAKSTWAPIVDKALEKFDTIKVNLQDQDGKDFMYDFNLDPKQIEGINETVTNVLASQNAEVGKEALSTVMQKVQERLLLNNLGKIFRAASGELLYQLDEKWAKETNNPRTLNKQTASKTTKSKKQSSLEQAGADLISDL